MTNRPVIQGLYAITPDENDTSRLTTLVQASIQGGASVVQYRNKRADSKLRIEQSRALLALCKKHQVPLIINDDVKLCLAIDADGVHIGTTDGNLAETRSRIGPGKILGASCYNSLALALKAEQDGASYIAFGACFPSGTKPNAPKADISLFAQARKAIGIPTVAIGGITLDNAPDVISVGADAIAVIGAIFSNDDVLGASKQFSLLFKKNHHDLTQSATI
ncbi:MAG: thiamine phosphate synthase [Nitrosomonadales bacterium]|nr:thiamine phosphate synthase [Nitrosomonadales bacterium]